jgi:hypothetical protein
MTSAADDGMELPPGPTRTPITCSHGDSKRSCKPSRTSRSAADTRPPCGRSARQRTGRPAVGRHDCLPHPPHPHPVQSAGRHCAGRAAGRGQPLHDRNALAALAPNPPGSGPPGSSTPSLPPLGHIGCSPSTAWLPTPAHVAASCCICGGNPWISTRLRLFSASQPRWYSAKGLRELPRAAGPTWSASTAKPSPYCGSTITSRPENGFPPDRPGPTAAAWSSRAGG